MLNSVFKKEGRKDNCWLGSILYQSPGGPCCSAPCFATQTPSWGHQDQRFVAWVQGTPPGGVPCPGAAPTGSAALPLPVCTTMKECMQGGKKHIHKSEEGKLQAQSVSCFLHTDGRMN